MTYIEILNAFWNWRRFNVIPHSAADLFFCLLDFANATKWEDKITIPNSRITGKIDISEKSLFNARNVLIQYGLIDYKNGKKGQAGTYQINLTTLHNFINKGSNVGSNSGAIRGAIAEQCGEHNKDKEEDKDKIKTVSPVTPLCKKIKYAEFVTLTEKEYKALIEKHGVSDTKRIIEILNNYKKSKGKKYASDYGAINKWVVTALAEEKQRTGANTSVYDDSNLDYDELEKIMREKT